MKKSLCFFTISCFIVIILIIVVYMSDVDYMLQLKIYLKYDQEIIDYSKTFGHCQTLNTSRIPEDRDQVYLSCSEMSHTIVLRRVSNNLQSSTYNITMPPVYSYNDSCLRKMVKTHCHDGLLVPNVVHFVHFGFENLTFYTFLAILSAYRFQNPCLILYHADMLPYGMYWNYLLQIVPNIVHVFRTAPDKIYGRRIDFVEHKSDWTRLEAIRDFGGIYADSDEVILRNLDSFRNFSMTLGYETGKLSISNALIIASPESEFLKLWMDAYRIYNPRQWGEHSVVMPVRLQEIFPSLINVQSIDTFMKPSPHCNDCLDMFDVNFKWSNNYCLHLYSRYRRKEYTVDNVRQLHSTFGAIARYILLNTSDLCND